MQAERIEAVEKYLKKNEGSKFTVLELSFFSYDTLVLICNTGWAVADAQPKVHTLDAELIDRILGVLVNDAGDDGILHVERGVIRRRTRDLISEVEWRESI